MIEICFDPEIPMVTARGHAGAGDPGRDLICAGVTALILALRENTEQVGGTIRLEPGNAELRGDCPEAREGFRAICRGFSYLAGAFPRNVSYRETGDREA